MSSIALICGRLCGAPVVRKTRGDVCFVTANVRCGAGREIEWWSLSTFNEEAMDALERLGDGDAVAAIGVSTFETFAARSGELKLSRRLRADKVLGLSAADALAVRAAADPADKGDDDGAQQQAEHAA